jgi:hypothetical protein
MGGFAAVVLATWWMIMSTPPVAGTARFAGRERRAIDCR